MHETARTPIVVSGCVGPRGDGYDPGEVMSADEAAATTTPCRSARSPTPTADLVTAITMTNVDEAIGVARAAPAAGIPVAISFTVETDGRLPTGQALDDAIDAVDAATDARPGLLHDQLRPPDAFRDALANRRGLDEPLRGIRANASRRATPSSTRPPSSTPAIRSSSAPSTPRCVARCPQINVLGGCCGTDHRHVQDIPPPAGAAPGGGVAGIGRLADCVNAIRRSGDARP